MSNISQKQDIASPGSVIPGESDNKASSSSSSSSSSLLPVSCRLDYLTIKASFDSQKSLSLLLDYAFNSQPYLIENISWSAGRGAKKFDNRIHTLGGGNGGITYFDETNQSGELMLQLPGEYWGQFDCVRQHNILHAFKNVFGCTATRLDIAVDDYSKEIIPIKKMVQATDNLNVAGFHADKYHLHSSREKVYSADRKTFKILPVDSHYFGSRESQKFVRVYVHRFADGIESLRYEAEFKKAKANKIFEIIADYPYDKNETREQNLVNISQNLASIALGAIDFVDKKMAQNPDGSWDAVTKERHLSRCSRFGWWQDCIDTISDGLTLKISVGSPVKSLEKTVKWFKRQVVPSLASLMLGAGVVQIHSQLQFVYENIINRNGGRWYQILNYHARENKSLVGSILSV